MVLFTLPRYEALGSAIVALGAARPGRCAIERFANGELVATVQDRVAETECVVLGSVAPPDEDLLQTLLLAHTLVKEGARSVTALLPYLAYARQDRAEPGRSLGAAWIGRLLQRSGVGRIATVDVHSARAVDLFPIPVDSLSPAEVFAAELVRMGIDDMTIVAPDEGAIARADALRRAAGVMRPLAWFRKERTPDGIVHTAFEGHVGRRAVIVDDILDTGATLVSACETLAGAGADEIVVMVTHGLFTGTRWRCLGTLGVTAIYCTDTVAVPADAAADTTVLTVAPLLARYLETRGAIAA
jgi:ribose-phosphate pyrophosphokinase